jgi:hypothetical protein
MTDRSLGVIGVAAALVAAASVSMAGQARQATDSTEASEKSWAQPRTAWGDPDFQGVWMNEAALNLERPERFKGRATLTDEEVAASLQKAEARLADNLAGKATNRAFRNQENYNSIFNTEEVQPRVSRRTSAIIDPPDGLLPPWTLEQVKRWEEREEATRGRGETDTMDDLNTGARCIADLPMAKVGAWGIGFGPKDSTISDGDGLGRNVSAGGPRRILQTPGYVTIFQQQEGEYFIIPLDRRPAPGPSVRQYHGVPRGHWEGNTLVVEHTNMRYPYPVIQNGSFPMYPGTGETLKITERFTRTDADSIEYRYTVEDPAVYTRPYTVLFDLIRNDSYKHTPDLCHENNRDLSGVLANSRADEQQALENGVHSFNIRRPRVEELKKRAQEAAAGKQSSAKP